MENHLKHVSILCANCVKKLVLKNLVFMLSDILQLHHFIDLAVICLKSKPYSGIKAQVQLKGI